MSDFSMISQHNIQCSLHAYLNFSDILIVNNKINLQCSSEITWHSKNLRANRMCTICTQIACAQCAYMHLRLISMLYELAYCLLAVLILSLVLIVSEWILNNEIRFGQLISNCMKVNIHLSTYRACITWLKHFFQQVLIIRTKCFHAQLLVVEASCSLKLKCFNFKKRF